MYIIKPIYTEADYRLTLARVKAIRQVQPGEPESDELPILTMLVEAYESRHYSVLPVDKCPDALLNWIQTWFLEQCDGDWEHGEGVKILSVDNPGWSVEINVEGTVLEGVFLPWQLITKSDDDWYGISIKNSLFVGAGDPSKLTFLLARFRQLVETGS